MPKQGTARRRRIVAARALGLLAPFCMLLGASGAMAGEGEHGAADNAKAARGRQIAEAHCAVCHAIGTSDASPTEVNANTAFRLLYKRYPIEMLVEAAKTGSISGHDEMPGFDFTIEDVDALLAYIDSLAPGQPGYISKPAAR
jgi:mono/diheme cytochrome c family protein